MKLPDGRIQIVSYTADENGYRADVRYEEDGNEATKLKSNLHTNRASFARPNAFRYFNDQQQDIPIIYPSQSSPNSYYKNDPKLINANIGENYVTVTAEPPYAVTPNPLVYYSNNPNKYAASTPNHQPILIFNNGLFGKSVPTDLGASSLVSQNVNSQFLYRNVYF